MPQSDRVYRIASYLKSGQCLAPQALWREFATSPATIKRDIALMRDRMHLPVIFDRARWGYRLEAESDAGQGEPPRMLMGADEVHALSAARQLLAGVEPGPLLADQRDRLVARLSHLLSVGTRGARDVEQRITVEPAEPPGAASPWFETIATATLQGKRLALELGTGNGAAPTHEVSPQRLVHRAGQWHLDAWDHTEDAAHCWRLDAIIGAQMLDAPALGADAGESPEPPGAAPAADAEPDPS